MVWQLMANTLVTLAPRPSKNNSCIMASWISIRFTASCHQLDMNMLQSLHWHDIVLRNFCYIIKYNCYTAAMVTIQVMHFNNQLIKSVPHAVNFCSIASYRIAQKFDRKFWWIGKFVSKVLMNWVGLTYLDDKTLMNC